MPYFLGNAMKKCIIFSIQYLIADEVPLSQWYQAP